MTKIVLDTNFVTVPFDLWVDIYAELDRIIDEKYELVFPKVALKELEKLKNGKMALQLMKRKGVKVVETPRAKSVDDAILGYAKAQKAILATNDAGLRKKALKNGLAIITLRAKKYLIRLGGM
jgi:rRNA-processing protein FCF1